MTKSDGNGTIFVTSASMNKWAAWTIGICLTIIGFLLVTGINDKIDQINQNAKDISDMKSSLGRIDERTKAITEGISDIKASLREKGVTGPETAGQPPPDK